MGDLAQDIHSNFENQKVKALINIKYTANWLHNKEVSFFKPFGISPQQYNILRILRGAGQAVKVQIVKERMIDRAPNATRLMDKLTGKHLIDRVRCEEDRRVVFVEINRNGLALLKQINSAFEIDLLNKLSEKEAKNLSDILDKIR